MKKTVITLAAVFALSTSALAGQHSAWIAIVGYKSGDTKWLAAHAVSAGNEDECKVGIGRFVKSMIRDLEAEGRELEARFLTCVGVLELDPDMTLRSLKEMSEMPKSD